MNNLAADKIKMLKASIRCFGFGLLGLVPLMGLPFAIAALVFSGQARRREKTLWNAARPLRLAGAACAILGPLGWFIAFAVMAILSGANNH